MLKGESRQPPRRGRPRKAAGETLANGVAGRSQRDAGVSFLERGPDEKLFRFHIGGRLRKLLAQAMKRAGLKFPRRQGGFHLFCHTYGTWMTRYGGLDTCGLVRCFDGGPLQLHQTMRRRSIQPRGIWTQGKHRNWARLAGPKLF